MSLPASAMPPRIGDVLLNYDADSLTLMPRAKSVTMNAVINGALALWMSYMAYRSASQGQWAFMAVCIFFVLLDLLIFWASLKKRNEFLILDRKTDSIHGTDNLRGKQDVEVAKISEVQRVQIGEKQFGFIVAEQEVRPATLFLTMRDKAEARWLGQVIADFLGVPLQVLA